MKKFCTVRTQGISISDLPDSKELLKELSKVKYRERYFRTLRGTIFTLITVAASAVLVASIWLPVLQIYGNSMTPNLKAGDMIISVNSKNLEQGDVVAFHYKSYGTFLILKKPYNSTVELPTTEIIEAEFSSTFCYCSNSWYFESVVLICSSRLLLSCSNKRRL